MKKCCIHTDQQGFETACKKYENTLQVLQDIVDAYNAMNLGKLTTLEMDALFNDPKGFVFDKLTEGKEISIGGLTINRSKALDIMNPPDGFEAFMSALNIAEKQLPAQQISFNNPQQSYQISEDGEVEINDSLKEQIMNRFKSYLHTPRAEQKKSFIDAVIKAFIENDMAKHYLGSQKTVGILVDELLIQDLDKRHLKPNHNLLNWDMGQPLGEQPGSVLQQGIHKAVN